MLDPADVQEGLWRQEVVTDGRWRGSFGLTGGARAAQGHDRGVGDDTSGARTLGGDGAIALRGRGAERARQPRPGDGVGMGPREMQHDPADGAHDLHPDRDQRLP